MGFKKLVPSVHSLHPSQLEVICYEYLRYRGILNALIIPVGRTIPDIDIYGIDEAGNSIIAQVTHSTNEGTIKKKRNQLEKFGKDKTSLYFFGPKEVHFDHLDIAFIAIEEVYDTLQNAGSVYGKMLEKMQSWG